MTFLSRNVYAAVSGSTSDFAISFPYLDTDHVEVRAYLSADLAPETLPAPLDATTYEYTSTSSIHFHTPPATLEGGTCVVDIRRNTPKALSTLPSPSTLNAAALNDRFLTLLYIAQEAFDEITYGSAGDSLLRGQLADPLYGAGMVEFKQQGGFTVPRSVRRFLQDQPYTADDVGLVADPEADNHQLLSEMFSDAIAYGLRIRFNQRGRRYGTTGGAGIPLALTKDLVVEGNGCEIVLTSAPTLNPTPGAASGKVFFKIDGGGHLFRLEDLYVDFGLTKAFFLDTYNCDLDVSLCRSRNGTVGTEGSGDMATFLFMNLCTGHIRRNYCINTGYQFYLGYTAAGYPSSHLIIEDNWGQDFCTPGDVGGIFRGDGFNGCCSDSIFRFNHYKNLWGIGNAAGLDVRSERNVIAYNQLEGVSGVGLNASDITPGGLRNREMSIVGNKLKMGGTNIAALSLTHLDKAEVIGNEVKGFDFAITIEDSTSLSLVANQLDGTGAGNPACAINVTTATGDVLDVEISGGSGRNFTAGYGIQAGSSGGHSISRFRVNGGEYRGNSGGLRILNGEGSIQGVDARGNSGTDILLSAGTDFDIRGLLYDTGDGVASQALAGVALALGNRHGLEAPYLLNNPGAVSVTSQTGAREGRLYMFVGANGNTTINHSATIQNAGAANRVVPSAGWIVYRAIAGNVLLEHQRSF